MGKQENLRYFWFAVLPPGLWNLKHQALRLWLDVCPPPIWHGALSLGSLRGRCGACLRQRVGPGTRCGTIDPALVSELLCPGPCLHRGALDDWPPQPPSFAPGDGDDEDVIVGTKVQGHFSLSPGAVAAPLPAAPPPPAWRLLPAALIYLGFTFLFMQN